MDRVRTTMKGRRGRSDRAEGCSCVRLDDRRGWKCRFNTRVRSPMHKKLVWWYLKKYELVLRGNSESNVTIKTEWLHSASERFPPLKPLPEGFEFLDPLEKESKLKQLVMEQADAAAGICPQYQADLPDDMQVDEGCGTDPASQGIAITPRSPVDSSQNVALGSVRSERSPGVPPGSTFHPRSFTLGQLDNPEGRPPPSFHQRPDELLLSMSDVEHWASIYPHMFPEFEGWKQQTTLFVNNLNELKMNKHLALKSRSNLRESLEEIPSRLPEGILAEDPQNHLSKASMEGGFQDVGFQGRLDFGVKSNETRMPHGEDGPPWNRSISEALEVVPRLTGRLKANVGDIRPTVYGGSADGNLRSKPIMEGFSPQASDLQVNHLCGGGEDPAIMPNPGGNILPIDPVHQLSTYEWERWADGLDL